MDNEGKSVSDQLNLLADVIKMRRMGLQLTKDEAAKACGLANMTYRKVEDGQPLRDVNYTKIEKGLQLPAGSCLNILNGAKSITLDSGVVIPPPSRDALPDGLLDDVKAGIRVAAAQHGPDLTLRQVEKIVDLVAGRLQKKY
ncbi:hypothetical protein OG497_38095 [Streptomyces sp. NBC_01242]|uniref:hypothetical protein n=1 Tax=Streptomyces sp. NBC_01242 TaxID=2903795 RepID=UPI002252963A|nr:hypothetical protein [Streptomyces sp. NBC_01242]MCX4799672.1 hypothetical protein [Streptomyces sp. NBC_01242]